MFAAYAARFTPDNPALGLDVGERPDPVEQENWSVVKVRCAALNHHDLWSLRGVGLRPEQLPMILGTDAAGVAPDGTEVIVHGVIGADGHGVGPKESRSLLSERYSGTLAEYVAVPTKNLIPKPAEISFEEASCLPTAWLTAYSMLFTAGQLCPGDRVLIQGAGGGVASAAVLLAKAAGLEVVVTSRSAEKRARALELGASAALEPGARLPFRADVVLETVGRATWSHSVRSVRPGGMIVVAGATTGDAEAAELQRIFFQEITVRGVTMGSREDLTALSRFVAHSGVRPIIDSAFPLSQAREAVARLDSGDAFGKIVMRM